MIPLLFTAALWHGIVVDSEHRCAPYDRADYPYPQSVEAEIVVRSGICSPYTGECFESIRDSDIEHIIALSEAHDSGMCGRSPVEKQRFATDIDNLTLAAPALNRNEKRAKDAAEWLPPVNRCWFAHRVITVRQKYDLTIDEAEAAALDLALASCPEGAFP